MLCTYSESRVGSQLQETLESRRAQVGRSDVQRGAKVEVTTGGIYLCKKGKTIKSIYSMGVVYTL